MKLAKKHIFWLFSMWENQLKIMRKVVYQANERPKSIKEQGKGRSSSPIEIFGYQ
jgi:hypothetical protein